MVIEAGVAAGYVVAWALRKAQRAGKRLDAEADVALDLSLDRLHEVVAARLGDHTVLAELVDEAEQAGEVSDLTEQQITLALAAAARKDDAFGQTITDLVAQLREAQSAAGPTASGDGSAVFTGNVHATARGNGIVFGQVAGGVSITREAEGPQRPGRNGH
jgi:hypothetical protein